MSIVAIAGDVTTTTAVALAAAWPLSEDTVLIEADPSGGDLAAWFDMPVAPSLSTVVTRVLDGSWPEIERHTRLADAGLRLIPAPPSAAEAAQAVAESSRSLVATLAALKSPVVIADTGRLALSPATHPFIGAAAVTVVVHRQAEQSARAAAVRLQRLADAVESFATLPTSVIVAVVGTAPFDLGEIESFLANSAGSSSIVALPVDELAAAVFGGRTGVSPRRLARLPLMRGAAGLAATVDRALAPTTSALWRSGR